MEVGLVEARRYCGSFPNSAESVTVILGLSIPHPSWFSNYGAAVPRTLRDCMSTT